MNTTKHQTIYALIDQFDELRSQTGDITNSSDSDNPWLPDQVPEANRTATFFELTTLYGIWLYVEKKLSQLSVTLRTEATRLSRYILPPLDIYVKGRAPPPRLEMVSLLLDFRARLQVRHGAWGNTLKYATTVDAPHVITKYKLGENTVEVATPDVLTLRYITIMKLLVSKGADPYAHIPHVPEDALGIVEKFFIPNNPLESAELLDEILKARAAAQNKRPMKRQNEDAGQGGKGSPGSIKCRIVDVMKKGISYAGIRSNEWSS